MNQQDIEQVVKAVLLKMQSSDTPPAAVHEMGVFASLDDAVAAAKVAQQGLKSVAMRQLAIAAIREAGEKHARDLAELAVSETGMGRVEDKFAKNVAQARGTPGVECLSPQVLTGDNGLTLIENAPWGVVASVTPSTNPAATVINNAISLIAAGNSVIFAPHPAAKKVSQRAITLLNQAIVAAGGPENLLVTVANPDIETAQRLFKFPGIGLLVVTGGEAVVEAARKHTNKRLIAAGAGNPPVVVDETADLARAAQSIVKGASFDNNIICADEKVLIVVDSVADELMRLMEGQHAEIGYLYLIGKELPQNLPDAGVWFKKAAAQGNFAAHFYLGRMYQNGDGVERNMEKARFHLSNAAEGGIEPALKALNELEHQTK